MGQFLISYWWIILLVIIIIAFITKSVVKIFGTLIVIGVLFIIFWQVFISSAFSESTKCFTQEAKKLNEDYLKNKQISSDVERKRAICQSDKDSYKRLIDCLNLSKTNNNLGFKIYSNLPIFNKTITETIDDHNQLCSESPLSYPDF